MHINVEQGIMNPKNEKRGKKVQKNNLFLKWKELDKQKRILFIGIIICIAVLFTAIVLILHSRSLKEKKAIQAAVIKLEQLEKQGVDDITNQIRELEEMEQKAERDKILAERAEKVEAFKQNQEVLDNTQIKKAFQDTVILGDSIAEAISSYDFLGTDVVLYKRGVSIGKADELIDRAIALNPKCVFMEFGMNDLLYYSGDAKAFGKDYRKKIEKIQAALPNAEIYINGVLPIQQSAINKQPDLGKYQEFNQELMTMCKEMSLTFIDNTFLVEGHDELYEQDGKHLVKSYYPKWLTHMSLMAGI